MLNKSFESLIEDVAWISVDLAYARPAIIYDWQNSQVVENARSQKLLFSMALAPIHITSN